MKYGKVFQIKLRELNLSTVGIVGVSALMGPRADMAKTAGGLLLNGEVQNAVDKADEAGTKVGRAFAKRLLPKWKRMELNYAEQQNPQVAESFALRYFPNLREALMNSAFDDYANAKKTRETVGETWTGELKDFVNKRFPGAGDHPAVQKLAKKFGAGAQKSADAIGDKDARATLDATQKATLEQKAKSARAEATNATANKASAKELYHNSKKLRKLEPPETMGSRIKGFFSDERSRAALGQTSERAQQADEMRQQFRSQYRRAAGAPGRAQKAEAQLAADPTGSGRSQRGLDAVKQRGLGVEARQKSIMSRVLGGEQPKSGPGGGIPKWKADSMTGSMKGVGTAAGKNVLTQKPYGLGKIVRNTGVNASWTKAALGGGVAWAGWQAAKAAQGIHETLKASANMNQPAVAAMESLRENAATWATRIRLYGPSGLKHKTFKFDYNNPRHVKKALHLKSDHDIKKLLRSHADIHKHAGMTTKSGIPILSTYKSNDGKALYAGKTIGMRQKLISNHKKLGIALPKDFENFSFDRVNNLFKSHQQQGWYKRQYDKAPIARKALIGAKDVWRKIKNWVGLGKLNKESAPLEEFGTFMESAAPVPVACTFLTGAVADPLDCQCDDCRALARKLQETAESSFGQNLRGGANSLSGVLPSSSVNDVPREPVVANLTRGKTGLKQYKKWRKLSRGVAK